jgi:hypothetical protein
VTSAADGLRAASSWLEGYRGFWEESLERLDEHLDGLQHDEDRA